MVHNLGSRFICSLHAFEKISKGFLPLFACAAGLRVQTTSAMQASFNFEIRIVSADNTALPVNGDFGMSPFRQ